MTDTTITSDERRTLRMWFRQAIVEVERKEALNNIIEFYAGDQKKSPTHHMPIARRVNRRLPPVHSHEMA